MTKNELVLAALRQSRAGLTVLDFPAGFRLGARIFDLRRLGYHITTRPKTLPGGSVVALYRLEAEPQTVEAAPARRNNDTLF
jgi:hypothetical protein